MKAIVVNERGDPDVLRFQETARPTPSADEVLIRVNAAGVNFADAMQHMGTYPLKLDLPYTPGMEVVGTVCEVGREVESVKVGDRVAAISFRAGAYAEYVAVPAGGVVAVPENVNTDQVLAFMIQGVTAYALLDYSARISQGDRLLVHAAAGGVGNLAVQIGRLLGAGTVIGLVGADGKTEQLEALGVDHVFNYRTENWAELISDLDLTLDVVLDPVGESAVADNLKILSLEGRLVSFGWLSGACPSLTSEQCQSMLFRNQSLVGFALNILMDLHPDYVDRALRHMVGWLASGELKPIMGETYSLEDAAAAHAALLAGETSGKVVIRISDEP